MLNYIQIMRLCSAKEVKDVERFLDAVASWWEWVLSIARSFQFKDAIDILIIGLLLYGAIKLVRETRAGQLVKGLLLLGRDWCHVEHRFPP